MCHRWGASSYLYSLYRFLLVSASVTGRICQVYHLWWRSCMSALVPRDLLSMTGNRCWLVGEQNWWICLWCPGFPKAADNWLYQLMGKFYQVQMCRVTRGQMGHFFTILCFSVCSVVGDMPWVLRGQISVVSWTQWPKCLCCQIIHTVGILNKMCILCPCAILMRRKLYTSL